MPRRRPLPVASVALLLALSGVTRCASLGPAGAAPSPPPTLPALAGLGQPVSYERDVAPVLESRCVVCHGCYDAPCQLLLSSPDGAVRGASHEVVYDTNRLRAAAPTRLGIDARTTDEWRERGFFSVFAEPGAPAEDSLFVRMLALGRAHPFAPGERLPDSVGLDIDRTLTCARPEAFDAYASEHLHGGMPYGMAPLADAELRVLAAWAVQGASAPPAPASIPAHAHAQVEAWERFLNGASLRERVVARYLYEHWFVAHLTFADLPAGPFFRVVRSRTPSGQPIDEIATRRPYDDPGALVFYRLQPITGAIVHKTHIVYRLSPARMARLRALFLAGPWQPTRFPGYDAAEASNPFVAFAEIPARSRYQFLLDDSHYFVMTFIRGPVCRGQVAVDVIEDQFWISFLDPDHDLSVTNPAFLAETKHLLDLPAAHADSISPRALWLEYDLKQRHYLKARERFEDQADPARRGPALAWVWNGGSTNPDALLTVFRNFDNATVVKGFAGGVPKTAWIIDFPLLERIYYDLVAGYDVFGAVGHQLATRLYMDHLRMQSENLFLSFLPVEQRAEIRASWYVGATKQLGYRFVDRLGADRATRVRFTKPDVKADLLLQIHGQAAAVAGPPDLLNRCGKPPCDRPGASAVEHSVERALEGLASVRGAWVPSLPELSFLRVRVDASGSRDLVYSLVRNTAHTNVAFLFGEEKRLVPEDDTVSVMRGTFGSYPNFRFETDAVDAGAFADALRAVTSDADFERFAAQYGVRRSDPRFWAGSDWLHAHDRRANPTEAGLYDYGRYGNW